MRGAVSCDADTVDEIEGRTRGLVTEILESNNLARDDLVSIIFTATPDLTAQFPATAARTLGLDDVPLLGAQEIAVPGALERVIRVLVHAYSDRPRVDIRHVYLGRAQALRGDLAAPPADPATPPGE